MSNPTGNSPSPDHAAAPGGERTTDRDILRKLEGIVEAVLETTDCVGDGEFAENLAKDLRELVWIAQRASPAAETAPGLVALRKGLVEELLPDGSVRIVKLKCDIPANYGPAFEAPIIRKRPDGRWGARCAYVRPDRLRAALSRAGERT